MFSFFRTAPQLFSPKLVQIAKQGHLSEVLEAIYNERANRGTLKGTSKNGAITVERIGSFPLK